MINHIDEYIDISNNRLIWNTSTDWNKGILGEDTEVVGTGAAAVICPKSTLVSNAYLTWHLNETEGSIVVDKSINERNGTIVTVEGYNPIQFIAGKLNGALSWPGEYEALDYITGGDIAAFEWNQPFSIECWQNHTAGYDVTLAGNYNATDVKGWWCGIQEDYLTFRLIGDGSNYLQVYTDSKVTTGIWQHLVITYDGSGVAAGVKFYLDGVLLTNSIYYDGLVETSIIPTTNDFKLGAIIDTAWGFIGQIDEFNIYTSVLSQENVDFRYNLGDGTETPIFSIGKYKTIAHYETNIFDSCIAGQQWDSFNLVRSTPVDTTVVVKCRTSDDSNVMGSFGSALVPGASISLSGQFIQFSIDFTGTKIARASIDYITARYTTPTLVDVAP